MDSIHSVSISLRCSLLCSRSNANSHPVIDHGTTHKFVLTCWCGDSRLVILVGLVVDHGSESFVRKYAFAYTRERKRNMAAIYASLRIAATVMFPLFSFFSYSLRIYWRSFRSSIVSRFYTSSQIGLCRCFWSCVDAIVESDKYPFFITSRSN